MENKFLSVQHKLIYNEYLVYLLDGKTFFNLLQFSIVSIRQKKYSKR